MTCACKEYSKTQVDEKWTGHSLCWVLVRRTCSCCDFFREEWEAGDHEQIGGPRMFADDLDYEFKHN
jgi:hypothetical protein